MKKLKKIKKGYLLKQETIDILEKLVQIEYRTRSNIIDIAVMEYYKKVSKNIYV